VATPKIKFSRPDRFAHRLVKAANALNSMAELYAETTVAIQDAARELIRVADEITEKERTKK